MKLLQLDCAVLEQILLHLEFRDLLRLGRVCKQLHAVAEAEVVWQQQWWETFQTSPPPPQPDYGPKQHFQVRYVQHARELRLSLKVQRMRLDSSIMQHQRELHVLKQRRQQEERLVTKLRAQLVQLQQAKHAQTAAKQWQLSSVQLYCNRLVQAHPVLVEAELVSVQQQLRVARLELDTIAAGIRKRQQQLQRDQKLRQAQLG